MSTVNSAVMNIGVHVFLNYCFFFRFFFFFFSEHMPRSGIAGS